MEYPDEYYQAQANARHELENKNLQLTQALYSQGGNSFLNENLIHYQLDTQPYLDSCERYLSGGTIKTDDAGNVKIEYPTDTEKMPLNEKGVQEFMRVISSYVSKETLLSVYDQDRIYEILAELGHELRKILRANYKTFGLDTPYKQSKFIILVLVPLNIIENCYRRALGGKERDNIKEGRIITQNQPLGQPYGSNVPGSMGSKRKVNLFKPSTW